MITPSLSLNFLVSPLDPRVAFSRSTTATRVNSTGLIELVAVNEPRFDYNPLTLALKGLLIEEQRTNLLTYSEDFSNAAWGKSNATVTANAAISPDGAATADLLVNGSGVQGQLIRNASFAANSTNTISIYLKADGLSTFQLQFSTVYVTSGAQVAFNLATGTVTSSTGGATGAITNVGNNWYRCAATCTSNTGNTQTNFFLVSTTTGDGTSGIFLWGGQLEAGAFATSYIPTVASGVTRNADVATIAGANFSDFWQAGKGGASVQTIPSTVSGVRPLVRFDDNTANEIIALRGNTANPELYIRTGGVDQAQIDAGTIAANTAYSLTGWWATNDCKARQDSGAVVADTTATIPTVTQMRIGSDGANYLNGTIATIDYYDSFFGRPIYARRKNKVLASLL